MSFCYSASALKDFTFPEQGETTKYQLKTFDAFPCIAKLDLSSGVLVTRDRTSPTVGFKAALGYNDYEGTYYIHADFPAHNEPQRLYTGGQLQYFFRWYPDSIFTQAPDQEAVSQVNTGWYHRLGVGVAVGGTMMEDQPGGIHYGVAADYTTWSKVWDVVETPLKLGAKFLITELKGLREFTGLFTLDLGTLWAVAAFPTSIRNNGNQDRTHDQH